MLFCRGPLRRRNDSGFLAVKIDFRELAESEVAGPLRDLVDAESGADVVEKDVTRDFQSVRDRELTMSLPPPAAEPASEEHRAAAATELRAGTDSAFPQPGDRHHRFENRSWRIHPLDRAVQLDFARIRRNQLPGIGRKTFRV